MFAGRDGRAILAHLFRCEGLAVCLYSGALRASHLRQTCACKIQVIERVPHHNLWVPHLLLMILVVVAKLVMLTNMP